MERLFVATGLDSQLLDLGQEASLYFGEVGGHTQGQTLVDDVAVAHQDNLIECHVRL